MNTAKPVRLAPLSVFALLGAVAIAPCAHAASCESLMGLALTNARIDAAVTVPAGSYTPVGTTTAVQGLPAFCQVHGVATPVSGSNIGFELWLPQQGWNGKLEMFGNGGYSSAIEYPNMGAQLARGYATLGTDTGHTGSDPDFAVGHPEAIVDWGHRAVHQSVVEARAVIHQFYDADPMHSYFAGCSTGGHQAFMEAQRYPADFDGIIAGDPGHNRTHLNMGFLWEFLRDHPQGRDNEPLLPASKLPMVTAAAVKACRPADTLRNGGLANEPFLNDPRDCTFDPASLQCRAGDQADCLTSAQVAVVKDIYAGPHNPRTGALIENGYVPGSEAAKPPGWASYFQDFNGRNAPARTNFWSIWVFGDPNWNWWSYDFDATAKATDDKLAADLNAMSADLEPFRLRGGKLITYHGFADPVVPPLDSINYRQRLIDAQAAHMPQAAGAATDSASAEGRVNDFYRLFMVPGMAHCSGGPGADSFSMQSALEDWVEHGTPPSQVTATKFANDVASSGAAFSRPLCVFPGHAFYVAGDQTKAGSYECRQDKLERLTLMPAQEYLR
jgi:feruloyl esterase